MSAGDDTWSARRLRGDRVDFTLTVIGRRYGAVDDEQRGAP
jgi:hypothetical protein